MVSELYSNDECRGGGIGWHWMTTSGGVWMGGGGGGGGGGGELNGWWRRRVVGCVVERE